MGGNLQDFRRAVNAAKERQLTAEQKFAEIIEEKAKNAKDAKESTDKYAKFVADTTKKREEATARRWAEAARPTRGFSATRWQTLT